jgi:hypothetical protein
MNHISQPSLKAFFLLITSFCIGLFSQAQSVREPVDSLLITVILKHQQDKNLKEIQEIQKKNRYWETFPPKEARVVSWYAVMGVGQIITLQIAPKDIRILNLSVANGAWGAFNSEFYPTYDYVPLWQSHLKEK